MNAVLTEAGVVELLAGHEGLLRHIARRWECSGADIDDLMQVGRLAVVEAQGQYVPDGCSFASFAGNRAHWRMHEWVRNNSTTIRIPGGMRGKVWRNTVPLEGLAYPNSPPDWEGADWTWSDLLADPLEAVPAVELEWLRELLGRALAKLEARERDVIRLSFLEGQTMKQIAELWGLTHQRVQQIRKGALERLRGMKCLIEGREAA